MGGGTARNNRLRRMFAPSTDLSMALWLYSQTANRRPMDYKYDSPERPSPYEAFGKFNFCVVGRAAGLDETTLLAAAGFAHQMARAPSGMNWMERWVYTARAFVNAFRDANHGDAPEDQSNIRRGMRYYDNDCYK
jgi:hypothetical protein